MKDSANTIRALRAKANDPVLPPEEAKLFRDKADELEAKYGNTSSASTDHTTTNVADETVAKLSENILNDLANNQWKWNDKYYDRYGNPRSNANDTDDLYEEEYKYAETDYDAITENEDW